MDVGSCKHNTRTLPFTVLIALFIRSLRLVHKVCRFIFIAFLSISRFFLNAVVVRIQAALIAKVIFSIHTIGNKVDWKKYDLSLFRCILKANNKSRNNNKPFDTYANDINNNNCKCGRSADGSQSNTHNSDDNDTSNGNKNSHNTIIIVNNIIIINQRE